MKIGDLGKVRSPTQMQYARYEKNLVPKGRAGAV